MRLDLYEHETVEAAAVEAGGVGGDAGAVAAADAAASPAATAEEGSPSPEAPAAPAWSPDDPAFRDAVEAAALDLFPAQLERWINNNAPQNTDGGQQQEPVDWNQLLNPLDDNYGANLVQLLTQRDQFLLSQIAEMNAPVLSRFEQESLQEGQQRIDDIIADDFSRNGPIELPEDAGVNAQQVIKEIAPVFMGQFEQRYGQGSARAAEAALHHATGVVRGLVNAAMKAGETRYTNRMATLSSAGGEPGGNASAIHAGDGAQTVEEAIARAMARPQAA